MMNKVFHQLCFLILFQNFHCLITNPTIGILTESNLYLARIREFNYTTDEFYLLYHHNDSTDFLQSFTSNSILHQLYICSSSTIYTLDLGIGSRIVPLSSIDDTPCGSSLIYLSNERKVLWASGQAIIQLNFPQMSKEVLWKATSPIRNMISNETIDDFYCSIQNPDHQSSIIHCRSNSNSCLVIDNGYHEISALAIENNRLYVADRIEHQIFVLTLLSNGSISTKTILPLNTSIVADIQSMFIYNHYLIWLTTNGYVRIVSLRTYEVRNLFSFDEQLRTIRLVSFSQWLNPNVLTSTSEYLDTTIRDTNPWKITAYITSSLLGFALFLCAIMITCVLLNYRIGRTVPSSFTNIFHILRNRTIPTPPTILDESL